LFGFGIFVCLFFSPIYRFCLIIFYNNNRNLQLLFKLRKFVTTWIDLEGIMLSKMSQTKKDKYVSQLYTESVYR